MSSPGSVSMTPLGAGGVAAESGAATAARGAARANSCRAAMQATKALIRGRVRAQSLFRITVLLAGHAGKQPVDDILEHHRRLRKLHLAALGQVGIGPPGSAEPHELC